MSAVTAPARGKRKAKVGRVVSDKMDKTIVVSVERLARHRIYKRVIRLTTKFKAHDENNEAHVGDTVRIEEARPLSATKRWRLAEIVNEETGIETDQVEPEKSFTDDLDIDSLSMMTIVVNAEEKFGVRIPDEEVKNLTTVGDAVSFIAANKS